MTIVEGLVIIGGISFFFYRSVIAFFIFLPYLFFYVKNKKNKAEELYKNKLQEQFQDGILAVSSALNAGYSVENAFFEAKKDLLLLYDREEPIIKEFSKITRGLEANERIEKLCNDFARRSRLEEVESFAEVFETARQGGGDLSLIIRATANRIGGKIEVLREIKTVISAKRFENNIMKGIPFCILCYVELTSPNFFAPMYGNLIGIVIMTACLGFYCFSCYLTKKILNIQV